MNNYYSIGTESMANPKVFIDGEEGTTGLRIREMLNDRPDLDLLKIPSQDRKDSTAREDYLNAADLAILCLPDAAAAEAVGLVQNPQTKILDTSTARRIDPDWIYGLPELGVSQRQAIAGSTRVANPGCYPTGFILAVRPLIDGEVLDPAARLTVNAVSGYSGGGKALIDAYASLPSPERGADAARPLAIYGLDSRHKHLSEMQLFSRLDHPPLFVPAVVPAYSGMMVSTPVPISAFTDGSTPESVFDIWNDHYADSPMVEPQDPRDPSSLRGGRFLDLEGPDRNSIQLMVFGDVEIGLVLIARLDNLGKGAAGNAVQCLNLMLGFAETAGLSD